MTTTHWRVLSWILFATWVTAGFLVMQGVHAGFLTNHAADLTQPAWLYIITRSLDRPGRRNILYRWLGWSPALAALSIFLAATLTEVSQYFWPAGLFRGTFDPWDIVAYGVGIAACYLLDR